MFGQGYQPKEYNMFVPEGDYLIQLGLPQDVEKAGYRIREIPIRIKGYTDHGPDHWSIFDAPQGDAEKLEKWNKARTRDCDAFGVQRGDFRPESWRGKTGMVHIGKDTNGYMQVKWSIVQESKPVGAAPPAAPSKAEDPFGEPSRSSVPVQTAFEDDIPF